MSNTSDTNWRSFVGPADNHRSIGPDQWFAPPNPRDYDDLFKVSDVSYLYAHDLEIPAAREDSIDVVRGVAVRFVRCLVHGSVTLKGSLQGWSLADCSVAGTIEVGQFDNYWRPGRAPTSYGKLTNVRSPDGKPVRVKLWDATMPDIVDCAEIKVTRIPKAVWFPYFLFRYAAVRLWAKPKAIVACAALALLPACSLVPQIAKAPKATATAASGLTVTQSGNAQVPAKAESKDDTRTVAIPAGTIAEFNDKLGTLKLTFTAPTTLSQSIKSEKVEAPQAFTPPAPPTPSELADGQATLWYRLGAAVGVALAIFGLVRAWDFLMYGGAAITAACLFALFVQRHPVLLAVVGVGGALAIAGPFLYHTKIKPLERKNPFAAPTQTP